MMPATALGIPDRSDFGDVTSLARGSLVPYVVQEHDAERAGRHYDMRFGAGKMFSFAVPAGVPGQYGGKALAVQQPLHDEAYKDFEGTIGAGYGAGRVRTYDKGEVLVTDVSPDKLSVVTAHKKKPQRLTLIRTAFGDNPNNWLLVNHTPSVPLQNKKVHYRVVPQEDVEKVLTKDYFIEPKVDGASGHLLLDRNRTESFSYRTDAAGQPIVHTERLGLNGIRPKIKDTWLRGELYGTDRSGAAISPQAIGGILNSTLGNSLRTQQDNGIRMRSLIFGIKRFKGKDIPEDTPYEARRAMIREALSNIPTDRMEMAPSARGDTPEARKMVDDIFAGRNPLTHEGIVAHPVAGGVPIKVKSRPEADVYIRSAFPGGKQPGSFGGFDYSLTPDGPVVGRVGSGFSNDTSKNLDKYVGRIARIAAQHQFPSGAYRAPSFIALHEG